MLSILIRNQKILNDGQLQEIGLVLSCVGNESNDYFKTSSQNAKPKSRLIDPVLDEMYMIHFQPFHDYVFVRHLQHNESVCRLSFKEWDKRLLNHLCRGAACHTQQMCRGAACHTHQMCRGAAYHTQQTRSYNHV